MEHERGGKEGVWKEAGGRHCTGELKKWVRKKRQRECRDGEAAGGGVLHY